MRRPTPRSLRERVTDWTLENGEGLVAVALTLLIGLLALSISERELLSDTAFKTVNESIQGLTQLMKANLDAEELESTVDTVALSYLLSMQIFAIANMGKLTLDDVSIKATVEQLISMLPTPVSPP